MKKLACVLSAVLLCGCSGSVRSEIRPAETATESREIQITPAQRRKWSVEYTVPKVEAKTTKEVQK